MYLTSVVAWSPSLDVTIRNTALNTNVDTVSYNSG